MTRRHDDDEDEEEERRDDDDKDDDDDDDGRRRHTLNLFSILNGSHPMCLFLIYFGVSGTNCTYEKASINIEAK